jgi:hypothetical protein
LTRCAAALPATVDTDSATSAPVASNLAFILTSWKLQLRRWSGLRAVIPQNVETGSGGASAKVRHIIPFERGPVSGRRNIYDV